ncbi:MAG: hypothetical protein LBO06_08820 [Bacteroidales bacterium]|nr:hypothetical protein [Bacteroidales bacterium]
MKKLFLAIALSVIAITGVISFVACSDDEKEVTVKPSAKLFMEGIAIPDGTYIGKLGNIVIENTYQENFLIKRVVDGEVIDIQLAPDHSKAFAYEEDALSCVGRLDANGWPCITSYSLTSDWGTVWVVEWGNVDANGDCWYYKYYTK